MKDITAHFVTVIVLILIQVIDKSHCFNRNYIRPKILHSNVIKMSKFTDLTQEKWRKDAEKLREVANTLEKNISNSEDSNALDDGFISTYASKVALNITKQKQNETLYFGPTQNKVVNITKDLLLVDRSERNTTTEQLISLLQESSKNLDVEINDVDEDGETNKFKIPMDSTFLSDTIDIVAKYISGIETSFENEKYYLMIHVLDEYLSWSYKEFKDSKGDYADVEPIYFFMAKKLEVGKI